MTIYTEPEHYGLTTLGEIEWSDEMYQFDLTVVWHNDAGQLFWADDSGCSCPAPFEIFGVENLTTGTFHDLAGHVHERAGKDGPHGAVIDLLTRARAFVAAASVPNPLVDFTLWQARLQMTPLSGLTVEVVNPLGRVVTMWVLDPELMIRFKDLAPDGSSIQD